MENSEIMILCKIILLETSYCNKRRNFYAGEKQNSYKLIKYGFGYTYCQFQTEKNTKLLVLFFQTLVLTCSRLRRVYLNTLISARKYKKIAEFFLQKI